MTLCVVVPSSSNPILFSLRHFPLIFLLHLTHPSGGHLFFTKNHTRKLARPDAAYKPAMRSPGSSAGLDRSQSLTSADISPERPFEYESITTGGLKQTCF